MWKWYDAKVVKIIQEAPLVKRFYLAVADTPSFTFEAGQFITLDLPISDKRLQRWRSYSIASRPDGGNIIELCVVKMPDGKGSTYLLEEVKIGTMLRFKGADGGFVLPKNLEKPLVLICTGTGIAPFRSMIQTIFAENIPHHSIHLVFGTREKNSILYEKEWAALSAAQPSFQFSAALSREKTAEHHHGYVHSVYSPTISVDNLYMICGWSKMIDDVVANLVAAGVPLTQIKYELYG